MPRYHFNVYDGVTVLDPDGVELADWERALYEAIRNCGEVLNDNAKRIALGEDWRMEITDDTGLVLFRSDFSVMRSAATMSLRTDAMNQNIRCSVST